MIILILRVFSHQPVDRQLGINKQLWVRNIKHLMMNQINKKVLWVAILRLHRKRNIQRVMVMALGMGNIAVVTIRPPNNTKITKEIILALP